MYNIYETYQTGFKLKGLGPASEWDRGQNFAFSEYGHVAYQIKRNGVWINMVANFLPVDPFPTLGVGSEGQPISEHGNCISK